MYEEWGLDISIQLLDALLKNYLIKLLWQIILIIFEYILEYYCGLSPLCIIMHIICIAFGGKRIQQGFDGDFNKLG